MHINFWIEKVRAFVKSLALCTAWPLSRQEVPVVFLLQFAIVYRVLTSKTWKLKLPQNLQLFQMSLRTKFGWKFWYQYAGKESPVRIGQFCSGKVSTLCGMLKKCGLFICARVMLWNVLDYTPSFPINLEPPYFYMIMNILIWITTTCGIKINKP